MDAESLLAFVRFHAWANDRIMTTAAGLSEEEFRRAALLDHGTAFQTLRHLVDVDWSWREFCTGNDVGQTYVWDHGFVARRSAGDPRVLPRGGRPPAELRGVARRAGLNEPMELSEDPDDVVPRWLILAHVVNHGTQHRSELARYLTECGHSPGELDLVDAPRLPWPVER